MSFFLKRLSVLTGINIAASLIFAFFGDHSFLVSYLNSLFFIGLFFIVAGAFLFVVQGGFFNGIIFSMKSFLKLDRLGSYVASFDHDEKANKSSYPVSRPFKLTGPILVSGAICCLLSLMLLL
ncbi:DUF3899 domain-containing protein [Peribacillus kribbensis]|uniref:DUF3899 domain-containing protein n=1 Tax=Peribacillus kribbensis TaxID=356658 RepID=UPI000424EBCA|nr:DUF3899 domain-containing protein [Peribacillus kribbensis]